MNRISSECLQNLNQSATVRFDCSLNFNRLGELSTGSRFSFFLQAFYLQQLRELMLSCDQTAKSVTISYFQHHYTLFAPLPIQVDEPCDDVMLARAAPGCKEFYDTLFRNRIGILFIRFSIETFRSVITMHARHVEL